MKPYSISCQTEVWKTSHSYHSTKVGRSAALATFFIWNGGGWLKCWPILIKIFKFLSTPFLPSFSFVQVKYPVSSSWTIFYFLEMNLLARLVFQQILFKIFLLPNQISKLVLQILIYFSKAKKHNLIIKISLIVLKIIQMIF